MSLSPMEIYRQMKAASEGKPPEKKDEKKEDKKEESKDKDKSSDSGEKKDFPPKEGEGGGDQPPVDPAAGGAPPPGAMPPAAPPMAPMAPPVPAMNPLDAMGQAIQTTTQGMNMVIDSFYAMQGGGMQNAAMPAAAPAATPAPVVPGPAMPPAVPPETPPVPPVASNQKAAGINGAGRYTPSGTRGGDYYNFLRQRTDISASITGGGNAQ